MLPFPLDATDADITLTLASLYSDEIAEILAALEAAGTPAHEVEARASAMVLMLGDLFGTRELGRLRRLRARVLLRWYRLRRWWRSDAPPPGAARPAVLRFADLWVRLLTGGMTRARIAPVILAAIRQASVERQLRAVCDGPGAAP